MSFFSSFQQHAGTFATIAAGAILAKAIGIMQSDTQDDHSGPAAQEPGNYKPSHVDVIVVRVMVEKAFNFPPELLDLIIDQAEYWPHSEASIYHAVTPLRDALRVVGTSRDENKFILRCPPIGFLDFKTVGPAFKTAPLPPKSGDGSPVTEPLRNLTLLEPTASPTEMASEAPREYFTGSMKAPPTLTHPVRKIVFKLRSKDQGWGGGHGDRGSYRGSWSWFEAGLEKFDKERTCDGSCKTAEASSDTGSEEAPFTNETNLCTCGLQSIYPPVETTSDGKIAYTHGLQPLENLKIQTNKTANRDFMDHEVVWSWTDDVHPESPDADRLADIGRGKGTATGKFVRNLKLGDVVTVWAKARFGGWANYVESVKVEIYWAV
ncbi:hypothetical protein CORC01_04878 [Colletotrichum orchidophilum]|uniref:Uncharacterized protein n=1 Tax=Colletotrichum orchidophilum TaxID=1209926 RepID=A0A1G4BEK8_9PEZI|nr:uncharacterized protein CORC01_04878 [Colletotrichum orchidophilum]OHE99742.1 hypothetical protein CORC01_04878 [Colletotrichum orchidophilum]